MSEDTLQILTIWLEWTKRLAAGESPKEFLPLYGIEGRSIQEIRQERLDEARGLDEDDIGLFPVEEDVEEDSSSSSSVVDEDDPESVARARQRRLDHLRKTEISDDEGEEDDGLTGFEGRREQDRAKIGWATQTIAVAWLKRARDSLQAPQLLGWSEPEPWTRLEDEEEMAMPLPPLPPPGGNLATQPAPLSTPQVPPPPKSGAIAATGTVPMPPPLPSLAPPSSSASHGSQIAAPKPPTPPSRPTGDNGGGDRGGGIQR